MKCYKILFLCGICHGKPPNEALARLPNYYQYESPNKLMLNPWMPVERRNIAFAGLPQSGPHSNWIHQILVWKECVCENELQKRVSLHIQLVFAGGTMEFRIPDGGVPWLTENKTSLSSLKSILKKMLFTKFNNKRHKEFSCFINTRTGSRIDSIMGRIVRKRCSWVSEERSGLSCILAIENQTCARFLEKFLKLEDIDCKFQKIVVHSSKVDTYSMSDYNFHKAHPLRLILFRLQNTFDLDGASVRTLIADDIFWCNPENYPMFDEIMPFFL